MINLFTKTYNAHKKRLECYNAAQSSFKRFFKCFPVLFQEILFSLAYLPHFLKNQPYSGFSKLATRDNKGEWVVSYSRYLTYKKYALSFLTVFLTLVGLGTSVLVFTVEPNEVKAANGCVAPYIVDLNSPSGGQALCTGDSLTFSGHWHDSGGACGYAQSYKGEVCTHGACSWSTISTGTPLRVSSGTYSGSVMENAAGSHTASMTKSLTASVTGVYDIRLGVQNGATSTWYYSSITPSITVSSAPDMVDIIFSASSHDQTSITWSWDAVSDAVNYAIYDSDDENRSGNLSSETFSYQENSLSTNTAYTRRMEAINSCGVSNTDDATVYTSIQAPTGISFDSVAKNSLTVSGSGTISNLASGSSGIYFAESVTATNSGWLHTNSWQKTGLTANTQYSFTGQTRNGDGDTTTVTAAQTKYTLAADANVTANKTVSTWSKVADTVFTNATGFGVGGVQYYRYVWDKNSTYAFNDTETQWSAGTLSKTATSEGQWYLHVKAYNGDGTAAATGATQDLGPYGYDITEPVITNNVIGDDTWRNTAGTTYDVDFMSNGGSPLDYAQYAAGTSKGASDIIGWTDIFTNNTVNYTTAWPVDFANLQEGINYVSIRVYDEAGNVTMVTDQGFYIKKDTVQANIISFTIDPSTSTAVITWTTDDPTTTQLAWGATDALGNTTTEDTNLTTSHSVTLSGLTPGQTYYVKPVDKDRANNESIYTSQTFATSVLPATVITNVQATTLSTTSVRITWTTNHAADSKVRYGSTTTYGSEIYDSTLVTSHSITITGLTAGATYHYEVLSTGNTTTFDADSTFNTLGVTTLSNIQAVDISTTSAVITWTTNHSATSQVNYGLTAAYGQQVSDSNTATSHSLTLTGLTANTTYHYQVTSSGNTTVSSSDATFATLAEPSSVEEVEPPSAETAYLASPTVISPAANSTITVAKPTITGLARSNNTIFIFIDSNMIATVLSTNHPSGTGSFFYKLTTNLTEGVHTVYTIARNDDGVYSSRSPKISFTVKLPYVTPTLIEPIFHDGLHPSVIIRGVAFNNSLIKVYLDGVYVSEFNVTNSLTNNTASFADTLMLSKLSVGRHFITVQAFSTTGQASNISNAVSFFKTSVTGEISQPSYQFTNGIHYTVTAGDSLWELAERFYGNGNLYAKIVEANKIKFPSLATNPSVIQAGWQLNIP